MARATIVVYHAVGNCPRHEDQHDLFVTPQAFRRQMAYLAERRKVVPLDAVVEGSARGRRPAVAIAFDDGYRSVVTTAAPILREHGFPATVFVPTAFLGGVSEWLPPSRCPLDIMTPEELLEAERAGVAVESHGHAHMDYARADPAEIEVDLAVSVERLTAAVGRPPRYLAYPFGNHGADAARLAGDAGFAAAFSIDRPDAGRFAWERVPITPFDGLFLFALKTSGRYLAWRHSRLGAAGYSLAKPLLTRAGARSAER